MTTKIPWPRIVAEGLAIVLSILLAFAIQAWWEGRQERAAEATILQGLIRDFEDNLDLIQSVMEQELDFEKRLGELGTMSDAVLTGLSASEAAPFWRSLGVSVTYEAQDGTLDGVISSGSLGLIRDVSIRQAVSAWKRRVEDLDEEASVLRALDRQIYERLSMLGGPWRGGAMVRSQRLHCYWKLGAASQRVGLRSCGLSHVTIASWP